MTGSIDQSEWRTLNEILKGALCALARLDASWLEELAQGCRSIKMPPIPQAPAMTLDREHDLRFRLVALQLLLKKTKDNLRVLQGCATSPNLLEYHTGAGFLR
jgi:hypothetical protein